MEKFTAKVVFAEKLQQGEHYQWTTPRNFIKVTFVTIISGMAALRVGRGRFQNLVHAVMIM